MGAASNLIAFDYKKYINEVVPSFKEGISNKLLQEEMSIYRLFSPDPVPSLINLELLMESFSFDLSSSTYGKLFAVSSTQIRKTESIFEGLSTTEWGYENLVYLFETMLLRHCAKYFLSIGKIYKLDTIIGSEHKRAQELIDKWSDGSQIWSHGSGGYMEGIRGWLTNTEVKELNLLLSNIELIDDPYENFGDTINSLKGLIHLSAQEDLGLLYGNDLELEINNRKL